MGGLAYPFAAHVDEVEVEETTRAAQVLSPTVSRGGLAVEQAAWQLSVRARVTTEIRGTRLVTTSWSVRAR